MDINIPAIHAEVSAVFARFEEALVQNQTAVLDALFWPGDFTVHHVAGENLHGIDAIHAFRAARARTGLARTLRHTVITTFGRDLATAMAEFTREGQALTGRQRQTRVRLGADGGRVVAARASLLAA